MKITVDSNIVFSAILNSQGKIGQLIINGSKYFEFYSVNLLRLEILEHKTKILKNSGLTDVQFERTFQLITDRITFVDEILLSDSEIEHALKLVSGIDEDDTLFVALTNHLKSKLWTGDKKLAIGLQNKRSEVIVVTSELANYLKEK